MTDFFPNNEGLRALIEEDRRKERDAYFQRMPPDHCLEGLKWVPTETALPDEGIYVLGRYAGGNWMNRSDPEGCLYVVVSLDRGARAGCENNFGSDYTWNTFGPGSFFAHEISHWAYFNRVEQRR